MAYYGSHPFIGFGGERRHHHPHLPAHGPFGASSPAATHPSHELHGYPGYPAHPFFAAQHHLAPSHSPSPSPAAAGNHYYVEEERAALAHLRAIQQRRQEAETLAARQVAREEAYARYVQQEREAAIQREVERREAIQREVERREQLQRQARAQAQAFLAARQAEVERIHQARAAAAAATAAAESARVQQARQAAIATEVARRRELAHQQQQQQREIAARRQAAYRQWATEQAFGAAKYAGRSARKHVHEKTEQDGWKELNQILEQVFGVEEVTKPEVKVEKAPVAAAPVSAPAPVKPAVTDKAPKSESTKPAAQSTNQFPDDLNALLSTFLGLRIDPLAAGEKDPSPATGSNGAPEGLNELLGQFGLVFEPDSENAPESGSKTSSSSTSSNVASAASAPAVATSSAAAAPAPTAESSKKPQDTSASAPLTSFLNGMTDLPPFVRDILENVEIAFRESAVKEPKQDEPVKGKGKGVADGEKPDPKPAAAAAARGPIPATAEAATPAESTSSNDSASSVQTLNHIADELHLATESFTFPSTLAFASGETTDSVTAEPTPALLFNRSNRPYHAQAHKLLQLLLQADSISSGGDKLVRHRRKEVVRAVEQAIEDMEKKRDQVWAIVKEKRQRGEEEEFDDGTTTSAGSVTDGEIEHIDHAEAEDHNPDHEPEVVEPAVAEHQQSGDDIEPAPTQKLTEDAPRSSEEAEAVQGFEVPAIKVAEHDEPAAFADAEKAHQTAETSSPEVIEHSEAVTVANPVTETESKVKVAGDEAVSTKKKEDEKTATDEEAKVDEGYELL